MVVVFAIGLKAFSMGCLLIGSAICAPVLQGESGNSMGNVFPGSSPRLVAPQKQTEKPTSNMVTQKPPNPRGLKHGDGIFGLARNSKSPNLSSQYMKPSSSSGNAFLSHKRAKIGNVMHAGPSTHSKLNAEVEKRADNCDSGDSSRCGVSCIHPSGCFAAPDHSGGVSCSDPSGCSTDSESGGVSCSDPDGCSTNSEDGGGGSCIHPSGCYVAPDHSGEVSCSDPDGCGKDTGSTSTSYESGSAVSFESSDPSSCGKDTGGTSTSYESGSAVNFESSDPSSCGKDTGGTSSESAGTDSGRRENHPDSDAQASQETTGPRTRPFSNVRSKYRRRKFVFSQMRYTPGEFKTHHGHNPFLVYWRH